MFWWNASREDKVHLQFIWEEEIDPRAGPEILRARGETRIRAPNTNIYTFFIWKQFTLIYVNLHISERVLVCKYI
jgi:hypothetical protein